MNQQQNIKKKEIVCGDNCKTDCHYFKSVNNTVSIVLYFLSCIAVGYNIFWKNGLGYDDKYSESLVVIINSAVLLTIAIHLARVYISINSMDSNIVYCKEFLSSMSKNQRQIEYYFRIVLLIIIVFVIGNNNAVVGFIDGLIWIYTILLLWDIMMQIIVRYNIRFKNIQVEKKYKIDFYYFLLADILGYILFNSLSIAKISLMDINENYLTAYIVIFSIAIIFSIVTHIVIKKNNGLMRSVSSKFICYLSEK